MLGDDFQCMVVIQIRGIDNPHTLLRERIDCGESEHEILHEMRERLQHERRRQFRVSAAPFA